MSASQTEAILLLQNQLRIRLAELGFQDSQAAGSLQRHLAEIAVLGNDFAQYTLPLFLSMSLENSESIAQLAATIKCDLDELRDALSDVQTDMIELMQFLNRASQDSQ
jgi:hypothetical protein